MSNYIPNKQKKNKVFHKREVELRHAIKHQFDSEKVDKAAEAVRDAKLAAIKAQFDETRNPNEYRLRRKWKEMTIGQIIEKYSKGIATQ